MSALAIVAKPSLERLREEPYHDYTPSADDPRSFFRHDRDRILYSSAFKRLTDVTQVVAASNAHVFHNRLTHSLQVAQLGQSIAERLSKIYPDIAREAGLDPDVVQAACLAHDLGHPPFGHTAEKVLRERAEGKGLKDGFEGNAQSFRIVTKLAFHSPDYVGLGLTRATMAAILKYPWRRGRRGKKKDKWGAYRLETKEFNWAKRLIRAVRSERTAEAEIMDWADDITYAVHDVEDFYRAGRIPLHLLNREDDHERKWFFSKVFHKNASDDILKKYQRNELKTAFTSLVSLFKVTEPYAGTHSHRSQLRQFSAYCINRFISAMGLQRPSRGKKSWVYVQPDVEQKVFMLKQLTWHYVIQDPSMASQRHAQRTVIRALFDCYFEAARKGELDMFPVFYRERMTRASREEKTRLVIDLISSMTERQAVAMYQRISGMSLAPTFESILD